jgi:hypothetical protein
MTKGCPLDNCSTTKIVMEDKTKIDFVVKNSDGGRCNREFLAVDVVCGNDRSPVAYNVLNMTGDGILIEIRSGDVCNIDWGQLLAI